MFFIVPSKVLGLKSKISPPESGFPESVPVARQRITAAPAAPWSLRKAVALTKFPNIAVI